MQLLQTMPAGGGATTFLALTDTPAAFTGEAAKYARVAAGETALEFHDLLNVVNTWAALQTFSAGIKLASAQQIQDSAGTGRILPATASPHLTLTGDTRLNGWVGVNCAPAAERYLNVSPTGLSITAAQTYFGAFNPGSSSIDANSAVVMGVYGAPSFTISASKTGILIYGLSYAAGVAGGSGATVAKLVGAAVGTLALNYTGTITEMIGLDVPAPFVLGGSPTIATSCGLRVANQGHASVTDVYGAKIKAQTAGTNRYGLHIADISGGTIARILELGPTPYLRLLGSGNWTPAANETPLYLAEGVTPTLRQVKWKDGAAIGAGDKVLVLV